MRFCDPLKTRSGLDTRRHFGAPGARKVATNLRIPKIAAVLTTAPTITEGIGSNCLERRKLKGKDTKSGGMNRYPNSSVEVIATTRKPPANATYKPAAMSGTQTRRIFLIDFTRLSIVLLKG